MTRRIAPLNPMPEFDVEAGYLTEFSFLWKMRLQGLDWEPGKLDIEFLSRWQDLRRSLAERIRYQRNHPTTASVLACLQFVDNLVHDWQRELGGYPPGQPLDTARLTALGQHRNRLNDIPGDKWEIKY